MFCSVSSNTIETEEVVFIYLDTHTYIHIHIYTYIYVTISIKEKEAMISRMSTGVEYRME